MRIKDEGIDKTISRTQYGKYEFVVVPFGLSNALGVFICLMICILLNYLDNFVNVFLDDIFFNQNPKKRMSNTWGWC